MVVAKKWVLDAKDWGLGNFIHITPLIKYLYFETGERVPVYFNHDFIKEIYQDHFMIEVLEDIPKTEPFISSEFRNKLNQVPDYEAAFWLTTGEEYTKKYKPFFANISQSKKRAVVLCGSGSEDEHYILSKTPDLVTYQHIIIDLKCRGYQTIFVGSREDADRTDVWSACDLSFIESIPMAMFEIQNCDLVIGNDTGLVHAAGTMDKPTFILWKDTQLPRCKNSGINSVYSEKDNWLNDYYKFIEQYETRLY